MKSSNNNIKLLQKETITRQLKAARGHLTPSQGHVCNGLARPVGRSMLAPDGQRDMVKTMIPLHIACGGIKRQMAY